MTDHATKLMQLVDAIKAIPPSPPKVREWVRRDEHWRWDGEKMTYTEGAYNPRVTMEAPKELEKAMSCLEVHPGTRIPIDQPLPSSEQPAEAVREFSHHTDFRFTGDRCEASVNNGPWQPVNDTIEDMAAIGAKEIEREPAKPEPTHQPKEQQDMSPTVNDHLSGKADLMADALAGLVVRVTKLEADSQSNQPAKAEPSVAYLDGKLESVAEAVSGLVSRVGSIESELKGVEKRLENIDKSVGMLHLWKMTHEKHVAEQWLFRSIECDGFSARLGKVAQRLDAIEAELHAMDDRMREHEKHVAEQWRVRSIECDAMANTMGRMARRIEALETKTSEPIHIQVASLIAVNQKLEADLRIVRKERDELQSRVDSKPDVSDDPYPRTYRIPGRIPSETPFYVTFDRHGDLSKSYDSGGNMGPVSWREYEMSALRAVRCPDPRAKQ